jgi:hypothetical protein
MDRLTLAQANASSLKSSRVTHLRQILKCDNKNSSLNKIGDGIFY